MTCGDVEQLLGSFLDAELPSPTMLAVARHAGGCSTCDAAVQQLTTLRDRLAAAVGGRAAGIDLTGVWPAVSREVDRIDRRRAVTRRLRAWPAWAAGMALAASAVLFLRTPVEPPAESVRAAPQRVASRTRPNLATIDRLAGRGVSVRREPKAGTTIIWVNYPGEGPSR